MPVPSAIADLSTTPGSNSPNGTVDGPGVLDDHIRTVYAFIRTLSDQAAADGSVTTAKLVDSAVTAVKLASNAVTTAKIADDAVTFAKLQNITTARFLGRTTAGSGDVEELTASAFFTAVKQAASTTATGVLEVATDAEAQSGSGSTAIVASNLNAVVPGMGQTLTAVTGSRALNTDYVNGPRVRFINITATTTAGSSTGNTIGVQINGGQQIIGSGSGGAGAGWPLSTVSIIPPGATYRANCANATLGQWLEYQ